MNHIIYTDNCFMHFFHTPSDGLCLKTKHGTRWSEPKILCPESTDGFSVFCDTNSFIHILCKNKNNDILYLVKKNPEWSKFTLLHGVKDISPIEFKICEKNRFLNFFYSAEYENSVILVHCLLSANAKPETLDTLSSKCRHFSINNGKIYYTNSHNVLGYRDFSDGKPDRFNSICENAFMPYAASINNEEFLLYKKNNFIYLNENELFSDPACTYPIILDKDNKLTVQWESNNFIRYLTSFNNGATWSSPMRFINNGHKNSKFCIQTGKSSVLCYGHNGSYEPVIYGKSNMFFSEKPKTSYSERNDADDFSPAEYQKLKILIDMQNKEIKTLRARIKKLENSD